LTGEEENVTQRAMAKEFAIGFLEGFGFAGLFGNVGGSLSGSLPSKAPSTQEESSGTHKNDGGIHSSNEVSARGQGVAIHGRF